MTLTDEAGTRIQRLKPNGRLAIKASDCTMTRVRAYYRAAKKYGIKISIKNTPDGMCLWRLA